MCDGFTYNREQGQCRHYVGLAELTAERIRSSEDIDLYIKNRSDGPQPTVPGTFYIS